MSSASSRPWARWRRYVRKEGGFRVVLSMGRGKDSNRKARQVGARGARSIPKDAGVIQNVIPNKDGKARGGRAVEGWRIRFESNSPAAGPPQAAHDRTWSHQVLAAAPAALRLSYSSPTGIGTGPSLPECFAVVSHGNSSLPRLRVRAQMVSTPWNFTFTPVISSSVAF